MYLIILLLISPWVIFLIILTINYSVKNTLISGSIIVSLESILNNGIAESKDVQSRSVLIVTKVNQGNLHKLKIPPNISNYSYSALYLHQH